MHLRAGHRDRDSLYAILMAERELMGMAGVPYRLADALSRSTNPYAAIVIDTRPSLSLLTEMALLAANDAIAPVEPRYLAGSRRNSPVSGRSDPQSATSRYIHDLYGQRPDKPRRPAIFVVLYASQRRISPR